MGERHLGVRHLGVRHLGGRHLGERHLGERHLGERHLGERHLGERHLGERASEIKYPEPKNGSGYFFPPLHQSNAQHRALAYFCLSAVALVGGKNGLQCPRQTQKSHDGGKNGPLCPRQTKKSHDGGKNGPQCPRQDLYAPRYRVICCIFLKQPAVETAFYRPGRTFFIFIRVTFLYTDKFYLFCQMDNNREREKECEVNFSKSAPFFMITSESLPWLLYTCDDDFVAGCNLIAISLAGIPVKLLNYVHMNNHIHLLVEGELESVNELVSRIRIGMHRFQKAKGNASLLNWAIQVKEITDLRYLRNAVMYISRNPYVANRSVTPFGYRWSGAHLLFNDHLSDYSRGVPFSALSYRERRRICRSHQIELPDTYYVLNGRICDQTYMDFRETQSFFVSANQYFRMLSRWIEVDAETAKWIGERLQLPDEDVFRIVAQWYHTNNVASLDASQRNSAAIRMKKELMCSNKQISQVLRVPVTYINELFPYAD